MSSLDVTAGCSSAPYDRLQFVRQMHVQSDALLVKDQEDKLWILTPAVSPKDAITSAKAVVASVLCSTLSLPVPSFRIFNLDGASWRARPTISGITVVPPVIPSGVHYASRFVPDESRQTVVELIPPALYPSICWETAGLGMFLFDVWAGYSRRRRVLFTLSPEGLRPVFVNHRHVFGGADEKPIQPFLDASLLQTNALACWDGGRGGAPWITRMRSLVPEALEVGFACLPQIWRSSDLKALLRQYLTRLNSLDSLTEQALSDLESLVQRTSVADLSLQGKSAVAARYSV